MRDIINRVYRRVESRLIGEDRYRLDVCGFEMGKQLMQVWDVEPAAGKVGALTRKPNSSTTGHVRGQGESSRFRARMWGIGSSRTHGRDRESPGVRERPMSGDLPGWKRPN